MTVADICMQAQPAPRKSACLKTDQSYHTGLMWFEVP
jgi:hypothetical protein